MTEYICKKDKIGVEREDLLPYGSKSVSQFEVEFLHLDSFFIEFQVEY